MSGTAKGRERKERDGDLNYRIAVRGKNGSSG